MGLNIEPDRQPLENVSVIGSATVSRWSAAQVKTAMGKLRGALLTGDNLQKIVKPESTATVAGI